MLIKLRDPCLFYHCHCLHKHYIIFLSGLALYFKIPDNFRCIFMQCMAFGLSKQNRIYQESCRYLQVTRAACSNIYPFRTYNTIFVVVTLDKWFVYRKIFLFCLIMNAKLNLLRDVSHNINHFQWVVYHSVQMLYATKMCMLDRMM